MSRSKGAVSRSKTASAHARRAGVRVVATTRRDAVTAARIAEALGATLWLPEALRAQESELEVYRGPFGAAVASAWPAFEALVAVMAPDAVLAAAAPLLSWDFRDPLVVAVTDDGGFATPVVTWHMGAGNALARRVAAATGGTAVVVSAGEPGDAMEWSHVAAALDLEVVERDTLNTIAALALDGGRVTVCASLPLRGWEETISLSGYEVAALPTQEERLADDVQAAIVVGDVSEAAMKALRRRGRGRRPVAVMAPRRYVAGLECPPGTPVTDLVTAVDEAASEAEVDISRLCRVATTGATADEGSVAAAARGLGAEPVTLTARALKKAAGLDAGSGLVGSVELCEWVARLAAGGPVLLGARVHRSVTVALGMVPPSTDA